MEQLFITGPVYPKQLTSIINLILSRLRNNNPKSNSKCYIKTANYIQQIYDGIFLRNQFDESTFKQFNMDNYQEKIISCKNDWLATKSLILTVLDHIDMAKDKKYLPFNKKFVNSITFASLFEGNSINCYDGQINCNFIKFINKPKVCSNYAKDITILKLKEQVSELIRKPAESFAKKYFRIKNEEYSFWFNIVDFQRWLNNLKNSFPVIYSEFLICCKDGNPFLDFKKFLLDDLKKKQGDSFIPEPVNFQLSMKDSDKLQGHIKYWLISGISSSKFEILKQLPNNIVNYYSDESFIVKENIMQVEEKPVISIEDIPVF